MPARSTLRVPLSPLSHPYSQPWPQPCLWALPSPRLSSDANDHNNVNSDFPGSRLRSKPFTIQIHLIPTTTP